MCICSWLRRSLRHGRRVLDIAIGGTYTIICPVIKIIYEFQSIRRAALCQLLIHRRISAGHIHCGPHFFGYRFENVVLDTHQYLMAAEMMGCEQTPEGYLKYIEENFAKDIAEIQEYVPVICGEWCLFNSYEFIFFLFYYIFVRLRA